MKNQWVTMVEKYLNDNTKNNPCKASRIYIISTISKTPESFCPLGLF